MNDTAHPHLERLDRWMPAVILVVLLAFCFQALYEIEPAALVDALGGEDVTWITFRGWKDHELNSISSRHVVDTHTYPVADNPGFVYPPIHVVFRVLFSSPGIFWTGFVWFALMLLSTIGSLRGIARMSGLSELRFGRLAAGLGLLGVIYYVQLDFRFINGNILLLFLCVAGFALMHRSRPVLAGLLLAAAVAFKLYPVLLFPYLLLRKQFRCFWAGVAWGAVLFLLVPLVVFGFEGFVEVHRAWLERLAASGRATFPLEFWAPHRSVHRVALAFLTEHTWKNDNIASLTAEQALVVTRIVQGLWVAWVAVYLWWERKARWDLGLPFRDLINLGVILTMALPLSVHLQPGHGVVLLIPSLVLMRMAFDPVQSKRMRVGSAVLVAGLAAGLKLTDGPAYKGLAVNICLIGFCAGLMAVRRYARAPRPS